MTISRDDAAVLRRRLVLNRFFNNDTYAAFALAGATALALIWANIGSSYSSLWETPASIGVGRFGLALPLAEWVNEGLMTVFFFAVGLDVRRELTVGELRQRRRAILPACCALGGLILPIAIFLSFTRGLPSSSAWGSVISTDTAFALGMLALVGPSNAPRLRVFLLTLAVLDDIGALTVIAVFYTANLNVTALTLAGAGLAVVWVMQRVGVWRMTPYFVVAVATWFAIHASGVHATLAGVLVALLMPVYPQHGPDADRVARFVHLFRQAPNPRAARVVRRTLDYSVPLNQRMSEVLTPYVNFAVVPIFAVANAGVALTGEAFRDATGSHLTWGIVAGLVVGKLIGITTAGFLVERFSPAARVPGLDLPRIAGIGALSGMGFTISLLVVKISIEDEGLQAEARVGVLIASVVAFLLAWATFRVGDRMRPLPTPAGRVLQRDVDTNRDHVRGPPDASATIVVYAAIDENYRTRTAEALRELRQQFGDRIRIVFRHHTTDDQALNCALALEAADGQGRFWEMHDALVQPVPDPEDASLADIARRIGLDADRFERSLRTNERLSRVEDDNLDAQAAGLPAHPTIYVHGNRVMGPANSWYLAQLLRSDNG
jgi:Na+/H+ antiporter NhaA